MFSRRPRSCNATLTGDDLKEVIQILASKFAAAGFNDFLQALKAPFGKWTDKSMPDPDDIGGYMYAWLISLLIILSIIALERIRTLG